MLAILQLRDYRASLLPLLTVAERQAPKYAWARQGITMATMVAAVIATAVPVFGVWFETRGSTATRCLESRSPEAAVGVNGNVEAAYATVFPAGRYCLWKGYDGTIAVEQTGWTATWVALAFLVLAIVALCASIRTTWWMPAALLMILVLGGWVTIWAMSTTFLSPVFWPDLPPSQLPPGG